MHIRELIIRAYFICVFVYMHARMIRIIPKYAYSYDTHTIRVLLLLLFIIKTYLNTVTYQPIYK